MFNNEFLKKLSILYVEDDEMARNQLARTLNRLFKNVILANNGFDGLEQYIKAKKEGIKIDLILSDVNMPKLNGLEMLEEIRKIDNDIAIIYTTARTETEFLLKAIELHADHYVIKPIHLQDVINKIEKVCEKNYLEELIESKNKELKQYLNIINNVAAILKMDGSGKITYANRHFLEHFQSEKNEVIGKSFENIIHKDMAKGFIDSMWTDIKKDEIWNKNIKYQNKENDFFYINSTVFKVYNENKIEYINIGFLSTKEVNEKREFHKKIIENVKNSTKEIKESKNEVQNLIIEKERYEFLIRKLKKSIEIENQKHLDESSQIKFYENELLSIDSRLDQRLINKNKEIEDSINDVKRVKDEKKLLCLDIHKLERKLEDSLTLISKLEKNEELSKKKIVDLKDILEHREDQLKKLKPGIMV